MTLLSAMRFGINCLPDRLIPALAVLTHGIRPLLSSER